MPQGSTNQGGVGSSGASIMGVHERQDVYNQDGTKQTGQTVLVKTDRPKQYLNCSRDDVYTYNGGRSGDKRAYPLWDREGAFIPIKPDLQGEALDKHMAKFKRWVLKPEECARERIALTIQNTSDLSNKEYAKKIGVDYGMDGFSLAAGRKLSDAFDRLRENGHEPPDPEDTRPHRVYLSGKVEHGDWDRAKIAGVRWDDQLNCAYLAAGRSVKGAQEWGPVIKLVHEDSSMKPVAIDLNSREKRTAIKKLAAENPDVSFYKKYDKTSGRFQTYAHAGSNLKPLRDAGLVVDNNKAVDRSLPLDYEKTANWTASKARAMNVRKAPGLPVTYETSPGGDVSRLAEAKLLAGDPKIGRSTELKPYSDATTKLLQRERSRIAGLAH